MRETKQKRRKGCEGEKNKIERMRIGKKKKLKEKQLMGERKHKKEKK